MVIALALIPRAALAAGETLMLDVQVNGYAVGKLAEFSLLNGVLFSRRSELQSLGIRVPDALGSGPDPLINLSDLPGLSWRVDQASQAIYVTAATSSLATTRLMLKNASRSRAAVDTGLGATLNYDLSGVSAGGETAVSSLFDLRAFSSLGIVSTGFLVHADSGHGREPSETASVRLDSTYTFSDPDRLRRYRVGDFVSGGLSWTRPVRLGGVQISSDFSLRPDMVTFPLPTVSGSAAVPSTVDVLVNGAKLFSGQVPAGPFEIPRLPVVTGSGAIAMTVTDALGRQVVETLPFYASSTLLSPGLQTFSAQVGAIRRSWGVISDDYGPVAAMVAFRRGLSPDLTVEANAEHVAGVSVAGAGIVMKIRDLAVLNTDGAISGGGRGGWQYSAGLQRTGRVFGAAVSATVSSPGFRDVAAFSGDPSPRMQVNATASASLGRLGSLAVAYAAIDRDAIGPLTSPPPRAVAPTYDASLADDRAYVQPAQHSRIVTASYSVQVRTLSLYATVLHDFAGAGSGGMVGLTLPLGDRDSVSASGSTAASGDVGAVEAQRSAGDVGDWGYHLYGSVGGAAREFAQLQYKSPIGTVTGGVDRMEGQNSERLEAEGSASWIDGTLFLSNPINDSFAVVDTNGIANVRVMSENRLVGRTDHAGRLLAPDLRAFDINRLSIEPTDIPADATLDDAERDVRPQDRAGVVVKFPIRVSHGALVRLFDEDGIAEPVGSTATLKATGASAPVGYDGEVYVQDLDLKNELAVVRPDGRRCEAAFDYRPRSGDIPTIGHLVCREPAT
jgi:outer membrane usher protein